MILISPKSQLDNPTLVVFLDMSRWIAAFVVFFGHLRNPLFLGYGNVPAGDRSIVVQLWYFVTGLHAEAVTVFFVLSGFLVGGIALSRASTGRFDFNSYAIDRCTRLFIPFIPALLLTAILDSLGARWFSDLGFYDHTHPMLREKVASAAFSTLLTLELFLLNLVMLQTIVAPSFGSNSPLWTISLEFWFYAVFGAGLFIAMAWKNLRRWAGFLALAIFALCLGWRFPIYLGLWLIGVGITVLHDRRFERPLIALVVFLAVLVAIRVTGETFKSYVIALILRDYIVALSFAWLLLSMRNVRLSALERTAGLQRFFADFSFSLYLVHFPLMLFMLGVLYKTGSFACIAGGCSPASTQGLAAYAVTIVVVTFFAWAFAQMTEAQTKNVRDWLKRGRLGPQRQ